MPERDFVADVLTVGYKGVLDFDGLYKTLSQWFKQFRYNLKELDYKEYREGGVRKLAVKWEAKKTVTDYIKYAMEINLQLDHFADVMVKNRKRISGDLTIRIAAYLEKDYEETWSRKAWMKFLREAYDRFVLGSKMKEMQAELAQEMKMFKTEIKSFLNLQKIGK